MPFCHIAGEFLRQVFSRMTLPRPSSAEIGHPRAASMLPYERMLLRKIGILAEHHARNIGALRRLRNVSRAPKTAWAAPTDPPPRCEKAIAINTTIPELSKKGNSKTSNTPSRTFTRVITTSRSRRHNPVPTVVKPFRGMETHTTAWKRKNREYEEVSLLVALGMTRHVPC